MQTPADRNTRVRRAFRASRRLPRRDAMRTRAAMALAAAEGERS